MSTDPRKLYQRARLERIKSYDNIQIQRKKELDEFFKNYKRVPGSLTRHITNIDGLKRCPKCNAILESED